MSTAEKRRDQETRPRTPEIAAMLWCKMVVRYNQLHFPQPLQEVAHQNLTFSVYDVQADERVFLDWLFGTLNNGSSSLLKDLINVRSLTTIVCIVRMVLHIAVMVISSTIVRQLFISAMQKDAHHFHDLLYAYRTERVSDFFLDFRGFRWMLSGRRKH